jgi:YidC/Oxa1 family membrane protein insertase
MSGLSHDIGSIFQPLLKAVADFLAILYSFIPVYPIDVALLTIAIMAILTPLTVKSTKNMAAMQALGPEMKKLQQKYKGAENRAVLNEEMMKLYKEHKVNPASGCLPMLLQMPAFLILYDVIRGITNTVTIPAKSSIVGGLKTLVPAHVVAEPRYIGHSTKMYTAITHAKPPGSLNAFGMDFAQKLFSHHSSILAGAPFLLLVVASVGLQYLQMSRLNARNPGANQANPQAAMLQKYMPLIFGLIYLNIAAIINVYFVFSSAIRIGTQEVLFRRGVVAGPPPATASGSKGIPPKGPLGSKSDRSEREIARARPASSSKPSAGSTRRSGSGGTGKPAPRSTPANARANGANGRAKSAGGNGSGPGAGKPAASRGGGSNGSGANRNPKPGSAPRGNRNNPSRAGSAPPGEGTAPKEHPRSKAKRERKAR